MVVVLQDRSFEDYTEYLKENRKRIKELLYLSEDSPARKTYGSVFKDNFIEVDRNKTSSMNIAATDSSEFVRELYNGKKLVLSRAYTKFNETVSSRFVSRVISVGREEMNTFLVMLMEHLEHQSVIDFLKTGSRADAVLIDGSITGRLAHHRKTLNAEGFEEFPSEYYSVLGDLVESSKVTGIPLLFVAKSSETTIFRRFLSSMIGRDEKEDRNITDHLLVKSLSTSSGYTIPVRVKYKFPGSEAEYEISTFHVLPDISDVPFKVDYVHSIESDGNKVPEEIISMLFFGYTGYKVYNIWLSDVDNAVKFRKPEVENIYMREFERQIGIQFYETRGERRVRTRI